MSCPSYVKALIELSTTIEQADAVIEKHTGITSIEEKIKLVELTFDVSVVSRCDAERTPEDCRKKNDYFALLAAVINRWR